MPRQLMSFDYAAKDLLRNKADHVIVEGLLTVLIGEHVTITKVLESESNQGLANGKFNRVDMICESDKGELILFEIQQDYQIDYFHRIAYGAEKAQTEYISAGDNYGKLRRVYAITIAYFDLGQGSDYLYVGKTEFRSYHNPDSLLQLSDEQKKTYKIQTPSEIFPIYYIIKVNQFDKIATTPLDEWINFLKTNEIKDDTTVPGLREARERLEVAKLSFEERRMYDKYVDDIRSAKSILDSHYNLGIFRGEKQGIEKGIKIGVQNRSLEIARNLKKSGVPADVIAQSTGLSVEEIMGL